MEPEACSSWKPKCHPFYEEETKSPSAVEDRECARRPKDWLYTGYWKAISGGTLQSTTDNVVSVQTFTASQEGMTGMTQGLAKTESSELAVSVGASGGFGGASVNTNVASTTREETRSHFEENTRNTIANAKETSVTNSFTISMTASKSDGTPCTENVFQWFVKGETSDGEYGLDLPTNQFRCVPNTANFMPVCPPMYCANDECSTCSNNIWVPSDEEIAVQKASELYDGQRMFTRADVVLEQCYTDENPSLARQKIEIYKVQKDFVVKEKHITTCEQAATNGLCGANADHPEYHQVVRETCPCWCAHYAPTTTATATTATATTATTTTPYTGQPTEPAPEEADACCEDPEDVQCVACANPGWSIPEICAAYPGQYVGCGSADDAYGSDGYNGYNGYDSANDDGANGAVGDSAMAGSAANSHHKSSNGGKIAGAVVGIAVLLSVVVVLMLVSRDSSAPQRLSNTDVSGVVIELPYQSIQI